MDAKASAKEQKRAFMTLLAAAPRQPPPCPHFVEGCGGCLLQEHEYEEQLRAKAEYLSGLYGRPVRVHPSPDPFGYRNRMDFVTAFDKAGLRKRGRFAHVVDIKDCLLLPGHARDAWRKAREIALASPLPTYNFVRHEGYVRYLVLRTSQTTREIMLILTTKEPRTDEEREASQALLRRLHEETGAASVWWTVNDGLGDPSVGTPREHVGQEHIIDEIAGARFRILPGTFFQANTRLVGELFTAGIAHAQGRVLDLCCGVGVVSVLAARKPGITSVVGVELNAASIEMARQNADLNGVQCEFVCSDMREYLRGERQFDTVICDPARPGLGAETRRELLRLAPGRIIYVSCNPLSHKEDLAALSQRYDVTLLESYDLFPQTPHIEVLSVLDARPLPPKP